MDIRGILTGAAVAAVFGAAGYFAAINMDKPADMPAGEPVQVAGLSEAQQDEVRALVRDTLVTNPEILEEVSAALEQKRADEEAERRKETIAQQKDLIFASAADHAAGNPAGDVTVVEFFDYNCPYCKRALGDINALLKADPNVKVVFKEFPVLSEQSYDAAVVGVAVAKQGLYMEFHDKLLSHQGRADKALALQIAQEVGADMAKLEADMADPATVETIRSTHSLADSLGINGTPAYVIGDEVLVGLAPLAELQKQVKSVRENGCKVC
ncbi:MAG: DsbA family protein [Rhodobiaceae bacterium]|nr:DsbA family protein [Rhodobiaceae bacterium]